MNLFRKITATTALVALTSGLFVTGVSAASSSEIEAANTLAGKGIIVDRSSDTAKYELNKNVLRQEIAAVARGVAGINKATTYKNYFSDVTKTTPNDWAWKTVNALRENNLIAANKNFRPESNITKAESVGMIVKAAYKDEYSYNSSKTTSWEEQVVDFAVSKSLTSKFTDYNTPATRGFVFEVAANTYQKSEEIGAILCQVMGNCKDGETTTEPTKPTEPKKENNVVSGKDVLMVELSPETPANGNIASGAARAKMLAFDVTAGKSDVTLNSAKLKFTGLGDSKYVTELAIYDGLQKVTKGSAKKFYSDDTSDLSFERDIVVKAGETKTLFVTATIAPEASNYNQTLQISLTDLQASSTVEGDNLVGSTLKPILVKNIGKVTLRTKNFSRKVNVGETATLADFSLDETSDKEAVTVRSITFEAGGSADISDVSELALYADGKKVDATFKVNRNDIVAELTHEIAKDKKVNFMLKGNIVGSVNDQLKVSFDANAIYAVGSSSKVSVAVAVNSTNEDVATIDIEGSEVNIAFNRSNTDEAKPGASDVVAGSIDLSSASDYNIRELEVKVRNTAGTKTIAQIVKTLELKGLVYDKVVNENTTTATYTFKDIDLKKGVAQKLPLSLDLMSDNSINNSNLSIDVKVIEVKDEDNNKTYTTSTTPNLSSVLSSNSFTTKTIAIKMASVNITSVGVNDTVLVLGNGVKTVLYKGRINVGDADKVTLRNFDFVPNTGTNVLPANVNISDIVSEATLNIGGKTFKGDVQTNRIDFNSINANIAAGANNVEMLLVATLKDNSNINATTIGANQNVLSVKVDTTSIDVDDSDGDTLPTTSITGNPNVASQLTKTTMQDRGNFYVETTATGNNKDKVKDVVLAGTNSVNLGEVKIQADKEDAKVKRLTFEITGSVATAGTAAVPAGSAFTVGPNGGAVVTGFSSTNTNERTKFTVTTAPTVTGNITVNVNGSSVSVAVLDSDSATSVATKIRNAVNADARSTAITNTNVSIATAAGAAAGANQTNATVDTGTTNAVVSVDILQEGGQSAPAEVKTLTSSRAVVSGDVLTYGGNNYSNLAALATAIQAQADVATATVSGNIITITGQTGATAAMNLTAVTTTPYPAVTAVPAGNTNDVDLSSTFKNVKLMEGSTVLADNATLVKVGVGAATRTYVTFKDFTLTATNNRRDAMLVADLNKYTTSGSETSAVLGDITIVPYNGTTIAYYDVEGVSSQEDMVKSVTAVATKQVSIVPVTVTVSVDNKLGNGDTTGKIKFTIDKGNNVLSSDSVVISKITMSDAINALSIRNDNNATISAAANVAANADAVLTGDLSISNSDMYEFKTTTVNGEVRIKTIEYNVGGVGPYKITNDNVIDLGSYTN